MTIPNRHRRLINNTFLSTLSEAFEYGSLENRCRCVQVSLLGYSNNDGVAMPGSSTYLVRFSSLECPFSSAIVNFQFENVHPENDLFHLPPLV